MELSHPFPAQVLIFAALGAARAFGRACAPSWPAPDRARGVEAGPAEKALGVVVLLALTAALWPPQLAVRGPDGDGGGGGVQTPYDALFRSWLSRINDHTEDYFFMRTKMDYLSSAHGLVFAAFYGRVRDTWPRVRPAARAALGAAAAALLATAVYVAKLPKYCCDGGAQYRNVNAYVGTLWIPLYLVARNATPWLMTRVATPMEWIGMHSLEFYLLQFHVFLTRKSQLVLYVIPKEKWAYTNMALVGTIYVVVVVKALELTNVVRNVAWKASRATVLFSVAWTVAAFAVFEAHFDKSDSPCSAASWGAWLAFAAVAVVAFLRWTIAAAGAP